MSVLGKNGVDKSEWYPKKIFIGGLSNQTTDDTLNNFFEQWGDILDAVVVKDNMTGRSRCFGFVTYPTLTMAECALKNRPHMIDGRYVETKPAVKQNKVDDLYFARDAKTIFLCRINELPEEKLKEYFRKYGKIINIKIILDKGTGQRKGFGFIEFDDKDSVDKAVFLKVHNVFGTNLVVRKAVYKIKGSRFIGQRETYCYRTREIMNWRGPINYLDGYVFGDYGNIRDWVQIQGGYKDFNFCGSRGYWPQVHFQGWSNALGSQMNYQRGQDISGPTWRDNHSGYYASVPMLHMMPTFSGP